MPASIRYGLILGVLVGALGFFLPVFGLHTSALMPSVFVAVAIFINVVIVFLALRESAETASWAGQVANSLIVGAVGALLIFASSWLMTTWVFPDYYAEFAAASRENLEAMGLPPEQVDQQMAAIEQTTPAGSAASGAFGTIITSVVAGALIGIFKRRR